MAKNPRIYIETCCLIDYMTQIEHKKSLPPDPDKEKDLWSIQHLLKAARDHEIDLYTSTLTIAECLHCHDEGSPPSEETQRVINSVLTSGEVIILLQADYFAAIEARNLRWKHGINLGGADGLHVASAIRKECNEFATTDPGILKRKEQLRKFNLLVINPRETSYIPDKYRIADLFDGQDPTKSGQPEPPATEKKEASIQTLGDGKNSSVAEGEATPDPVKSEQINETPELLVSDKIAIQEPEK